MSFKAVRERCGATDAADVRGRTGLRWMDGQRDDHLSRAASAAEAQLS